MVLKILVFSFLKAWHPTRGNSRTSSPCSISCLKLFLRNSDVAQWIGAWFCTPKGAMLISLSGHMLGLQVPFMFGMHTAGRWLIFLSHINLSSSFLPFLPLFHSLSHLSVLLHPPFLFWNQFITKENISWMLFSSPPILL